MFNIVYYAPEKDLVHIPQECYDKHSFREQVKLVVLPDINIRAETLVPQCDVLVGRGLDAEKLAVRHPHVPLVRIKISGYDILTAVKSCETDYGAKRIAMVGTRDMYMGAEQAAAIIGLELRKYLIAKEDDLPGALNRAMTDGCDAVIGGRTVCAAAREMDIKNGWLRAGSLSLAEAMHEAMEMARAMHREHQQAEWLRQVMENSQDAILVVDAAGNLVVANQKARAVADEAIAMGQGADPAAVFSRMARLAEEALKTGRERHNILHELAGHTFSVNCTPIRLKDSVTSVIVTLVDVARLQQVESQIRTQLHAKGLEAAHHFEDYIYESGNVGALIEKAKKMAVVDSTILIVGESGTGKELLAQGIHNFSPRRYQPFVAVNCAALPENLLESELFGYSAGAFTGSSREGKPGLFELAHKGTLFLDEVTEMPIAFQGKLLRALQESQIRRIGSDAVTRVDVRIIAATNQDPMRLVRNGAFRHDLLFRLNVLRLNVSPLRGRREDIVPLFREFLAFFSRKFGKGDPVVRPEALDLLLEYPWPGNVRELRNLTEQLCVLSVSPLVEAADVRSVLYPEDDGETAETVVPAETAGSAPSLCPERDFIIELLREKRFDKAAVADAMGVSRVTLWRRIKKYDIRA